MTQAQLDEITQLICNTWDFCGSVTEAISQWETDNEVTLTPHEQVRCLDEANKSWNVSLEGM